MSYGIKLHVSGDFACFTRPEMKVERVSYDVITPSAARGILEAIYWKPQIRWVIDRIHVLKPIRFTNIRRNEVGTKASKPAKSPLSRGARIETAHASIQAGADASPLSRGARIETRGRVGWQLSVEVAPFTRGAD